MSEEEKTREEEVFRQKLELEELDAASGGDFLKIGCFESSNCADNTQMNCSQEYYRRIYEGGFPHCAATVEEGSNCYSNDACYTWSVVYLTMKTECGRAWQ